MSDNSTTQLIEMYKEEATAPLFLSGEFQSPQKNFHTTEKVEFDVERDDEDVAIVIKDLSMGPRHNESNTYSSKEVTPPIYDEEGRISSFDMIKRFAGQNPFSNPDYGANAAKEAFSIYRKLEKKIRRAVELQASQVLQTGELTLLDQNGVEVFGLDFQPKTTHFVTVTTPWAADGASGDPLADVGGLAQTVRRNGKKLPYRLIFGLTAFNRFIANTAVKARLDNRAMQLGTVAPEPRGMGATFQGWVWVGHYKFEMWTYDGFYKDPVSTLHVPYVADSSVIMLSKDARLDLTYGAIPSIVPPDQRVLPFLPPRISDSGLGLDLSTTAWVTPNGRHVMVSAGTRPLTIPTAIDTFGCLTVYDEDS